MFNITIYTSENNFTCSYKAPIVNCIDYKNHTIIELRDDNNYIIGQLLVGRGHFASIIKIQ